MAWIESHQEIAMHPKTSRLMRRLGVTRYAAVGLLHCLWHWALDYAPDGNISAFDDEAIADGMFWDGDATQLVAALKHAGWLDEDGMIHDHNSYREKFMAIREGNRDRKRRQRERASQSVTPDTRHAPVTRDSHEMSQVSRPNIDIDIDSKEKEVPSVLPKSTRKTQLPRDWSPSPEEIKYAKDQGIANLSATAQDFRDYYHSHGKVMADWHLTFLRWVRTEVQRSKTRPLSTATPSRPVYGNTEAY